MPVTKTAKRALRASLRRRKVNKITISSMEMAIRAANRATGAGRKKALKEAVSQIDKAAKKGIIHKNKAGRIKSQLIKKAPKPTSRKASKKTKK